MLQVSNINPSVFYPHHRDPRYASDMLDLITTEWYVVRHGNLLLFPTSGIFLFSPTFVFILFSSRRYRYPSDPNPNTECNVLCVVHKWNRRIPGIVFGRTLFENGIIILFFYLFFSPSSSPEGAWYYTRCSINRALKFFDYSIETMDVFAED